MGWIGGNCGGLRGGPCLASSGRADSLRGTIAPPKPGGGRRTNRAGVFVSIRRAGIASGPMFVSGALIVFRILKTEKITSGRNFIAERGLSLRFAEKVPVFYDPIDDGHL